MLSSFKRNHEIIVGILLGIITICSALVSFAAALRDSTSVANYSKSIEATNHANTAYLEYSQTFVLEKLIEIGNDNDKQIEQEIQDLEKNHSAVAKSEYESFTASADEFMEKADNANNLNDRFALAAALYAIVMFLGSLSLLVKSDRAQFGFAIISAVCFLMITVRTASLQMPTL